jgi:predicted nucleic acid-binding protein
VILTDAGPLVALLDRGEREHRACVASLSSFTAPMLTTWPAFTEAMYLLGDAGGWKGQEALWLLVTRGDLEVVSPERTERVRDLMKKYRDLPMDLADATLVALAEERKLTDVFTLDRRDFSTYRIHGRQRFRIWP